MAADPDPVGAKGEEVKEIKGADNQFRLAQLHAFVLMVLQTSQLWNALLISAGFISFVLFFQFYSLLLPLLAIIVFVVSYHNPIIGTILSFVLILPAVAYQTPALAWLFLVAISVMLFKVFENWYLIAAVMALVSVPFAPSEPIPFNLILGPAVIPILAFSAMRLGSKRTLFLIPTAVLLVLLLSVIWQTHNASFLTLGSHTFATSTLLKPQREAPELIGLIGGVGEAVSGMFSFEVFADVNIGISIVWEGIMNLFFADVGFVQILLWSIVFYAVAYIPLFFHGRWSQFVPSLALLLLIPIHLVAADLSIVDPNMEIVPAVAVTVFMMFLLDWFGVKITREEELVAETKRGMFGLPGLVDLSVAKTGPATLEEIGNYESTKKEIHESILMPLKHRELTLVYGIRPPKGILLFGPPGTGKTLLMSALAKELRMPFYYVKCSEILSQWYGESEKNVAELFKAARKNAPCILFFDEIDSIGKKREMYANDETTPRVLSSILTEMDGMKEKEQVIVVAATNTPNILDPALLRPGRLDKIIYQPPPDDVGREAIFKIYLRKLPLDKSVDIKKLAKVTERFTGADIANVVIEAARVAAPAAVEKGKIIPLKMDDFTSVLKTLKPSVTYEMLEDYEKFRVDFERRAVKEEIKPMEERVVTWNDVIGLDDVRKILTESIELPLLHEEKLKEYKVRPAKGILLFGPPGTGKTLVVKAASHELKATFLSLTPADISRYGYEGAVRLLKETFNRARENAPAVLFIDELESIAPSREAYASKITEEMVAELLQQMDGLKELKNVILVGATNKPSLIDKALLRPGRLDKIIFVGPPNKDGRIQLFKHNLEGIKGAEKIDYTKVADETEGFTGADIASICQEVKLKLVRAKIAGEVEPEVTAQSLMDVAENRTRSVTVQMLKEYLAFVKEYGERR